MVAIWSHGFVIQIGHPFDCCNLGHVAVGWKILVEARLTKCRWVSSYVFVIYTCTATLCLLGPKAGRGVRARTLKQVICRILLWFIMLSISRTVIYFSSVGFITSWRMASDEWNRVLHYPYKVCVSHVWSDPQIPIQHWPNHCNCQTFNCQKIMVLFSIVICYIIRWPIRDMQVVSFARFS